MLYVRHHEWVVNAGVPLHKLLTCGGPRICALNLNDPSQPFGECCEALKFLAGDEQDMMADKSHAPGDLQKRRERLDWDIKDRWLIGIGCMVMVLGEAVEIAQNHRTPINSRY